jgi:hypothetical protein
MAIQKMHQPGTWLFLRVQTLFQTGCISDIFPLVRESLHEVGARAWAFF